MIERERQTEFLEKLLTDGTGQCTRLKQRILQAQHDEYCIRRALMLMVLIGIFSIVGLAYSAVLLPEFFDNATPTLVKIFCALGLGSLICMLIFGSCWLWYRRATNEINEACRRHILEMLNTRQMTFDFQNPGSISPPASALYQIKTPDSHAESRIIDFPRRASS